jgi:hypothetical protein
MNWRERLLGRFGPGMLSGVTTRDWARLLRGGFSIDPSCLPRALSITLQSLKNSMMARVERRQFESRINHIVLQPPIFILGHWRAGTTHLHQLIAQDSRFACPNLYQVSFPHTFLSTEERDSPGIARFLPKHRPMDNMEWNLASPGEDEIALCGITLKSPYMATIFPRQADRFANYLTFRHAHPDEIAQWRAALLLFLNKLQWRYGRPLVLKSPPHTARVRLLLEMFPKAKFVHIHRDPYVVFQSNRNLVQKLINLQTLQRPPTDGLDDGIIACWQEMYDAFFEDRPLIPPGQFHEMAFKQLERDPIGEIRTMYEALDLPEFGVVEPVLQKYADSLTGYKKNKYPELPPALRKRIGTAWKRCFEEWGYAIETELTQAL